MSRKCSVEPSRHRGKFHGDSAKTKLSGDVAPGSCHRVPSLPVAEIPLGDGTKGLARTSRNASLQRKTSSEESDGVSLNRPVLSGLTNTTMLIDPFLFPNPGLWDVSHTGPLSSRPSCLPDGAGSVPPLRHGPGPQGESLPGRCRRRPAGPRWSHTIGWVSLSIHVAAGPRAVTGQGARLARQRGAAEETSGYVGKTEESFPFLSSKSGWLAACWSSLNV